MPPLLAPDDARRLCRAAASLARFECSVGGRSDRPNRDDSTTTKRASASRNARACGCSTSTSGTAHGERAQARRQRGVARRRCEQATSLCERGAPPTVAEQARQRPPPIEQRWARQDLHVSVDSRRPRLQRRRRARHRLSRPNLRTLAEAAPTATRAKCPPPTSSPLARRPPAPAAAGAAGAAAGGAQAAAIQPSATLSPCAPVAAATNRASLRSHMAAAPAPAGAGSGMAASRSGSDVARPFAASGRTSSQLSARASHFSPASASPCEKGQRPARAQRPLA